jgi:hypothetical protein
MCGLQVLFKLAAPLFACALAYFFSYLLAQSVAQPAVQQVTHRESCSRTGCGRVDLDRFQFAPRFALSDPAIRDADFSRHFFKVSDAFFDSVSRPSNLEFAGSFGSALIGPCPDGRMRARVYFLRSGLDPPLSA